MGTGQFYVIGSCEGGGALHHEMAHGLYATNAEYRQRTDSILSRLPGSARAAMCEALLKMGYCSDEEILTDEIQAYAAGGDDLAGLCIKDKDCAAVRQEIQLVFRFHAGLHDQPYASP